MKSQKQIDKEARAILIKKANAFNPVKNTTININLLKNIEKLGFGFDAFKDFRNLRIYGVTLRKYYEYSCNGCTREKLPFESWQDYDLQREKQMQWIEMRTDKIESLIDRNCKRLGLHYFLQGDPRGACLYVSNTPIDQQSYYHSPDIVCLDAI